MIGKKTERLLLRVDEEMAREVRSRANARERTIQGQLRYLIRAGLEHDQEGTVDARKPVVLLQSGGKTK